MHRRPDHGGHFQHLRYGGGRRTGRGGGCDLLLVCHGADNLAEAHAALVEAVDSGRIPEERLDESVYRVLSLKAVYGLSNAPVEAPDIEALNDRIAALERSIEADTSQ